MADYTQPDVVSKRVRFYNGQLLADQDFIDEQKFHLDRERRQSRLLRITGVCSGLGVSGSGSYRVTVTAGTAVDALGRQLVLGTDTPVVLETDLAGAQGAELHLRYDQSATDEAASGVDDYTRWTEEPRFEVLAPGASASWDGPAVRIARFSVSSDGAVSVDPDSAELAGMSVPGAMGVGSPADPSGDLTIGEFGPRDRHLTLRVADDGARRTGIRMWTGPQRGFAVEHDTRPTAGVGLHVRTQQPGQEPATRLFVGASGAVGVGTTTPVDHWDRVVDVAGAATGALSVRGSTVRGAVVAHDEATSMVPVRGLSVGTQSPDWVHLVVAGRSRLSVGPEGQVGIGGGGRLAPTPEMSGWSALLDVAGTEHTLLTVRGRSAVGVVATREDRWLGGPQGVFVGSTSGHALNLVSGDGTDQRTTRLTLQPDGEAEFRAGSLTTSWVDAPIDDEPRYRRLSLHSSDPNAEGPVAMLELYHGVYANKAVRPSIVFRHYSQFTTRLEMERSGLHVKRGKLADDDYVDITVRRLRAMTALHVGGVEITVDELRKLKELIAGTLTFNIRNQHANRLVRVHDTTHVRAFGVTGGQSDESVYRFKLIV
jgi:hypothetical protein